MKLPCLLFDPECPMCLRFKQAAERLEIEGGLHFYPINDPQIIEEFSFIRKEDMETEVHLIVTAKPPKILIGHEVIEYLAKHNPKFKKLAWLLDTKVGEKASQAFYQSLNKIRQSLQHHCHKCKKGREHNI